MLNSKFTKEDLFEESVQKSPGAAAVNIWVALIKLLPTRKTPISMQDKQTELLLQGFPARWRR